jgi:uncharacterized membrane protein
MANPSDPSPAVSDKKNALICQWLLTFLLAGVLVWEIVSLFQPLNFAALFDSALVSLAAAATLAALWQQLPLQNVLLAALEIAVVGGGFSALGERMDMPFGPFIYTSSIGPLMFKTLPWAMPLIWVAIVLNSRGVARLILRPWRKTKNYGFRLIGLTGVLVLLFDAAFEPFATRVKHYWHWQPMALPLAWQGAPIVNFLAWGFIAVLMLFLVTPALISKKPRTKSSPYYHPLGLWLGGILLFGTGCGVNGLWPAVFADAAIGIGTTVFAIRGARW